MQTNNGEVHLISIYVCVTKLVNCIAFAATAGGFVLSSSNILRITITSIYNNISLAFSLKWLPSIIEGDQLIVWLSFAHSLHSLIWIMSCCVSQNAPNEAMRWTKLNSHSH